MLAAAVVVFREVLEAALIVGIVLAATRGVQGSRLWTGIGVAAGLAGAALLALFADAVSNAMEGMGQEIFNACVLGIAVVMLGWHNVWMSKHGREIAMEMKAVGADVAEAKKPLSALAVVVGVAVLREGAETVLFLYGILSSEKDGVMMTALGGFGGLAAGMAVGGMLYYGLVAIPMRYLFSVTSWLITLLAAGMAAQAVFYLGAAGVLEFSRQEIWDTSWLLSQNSLVGRLLHTLVGYVDRPSMPQLVAYVATVVVITVLAKTLGNPGRQAPAASARR